MDYTIDEKHQSITTRAIDAISRGKMEVYGRFLIESAWLRRFQG